MINYLKYRLKRKALAMAVVAISAYSGTFATDLPGTLFKAFQGGDAQHLLHGAIDAFKGNAGAHTPSRSSASTAGASSGHSSANCDRHFQGGTRPTLAGAPATRAVLLCFGDYAALHSGVTKTPLYSAEHLTREAIKRGKDVARTDNFHPETVIQGQYRAELHDYKNSGFDRGHMTPDKDAPWSNDLDSLANMVPQAPMLNRGSWADLEKDVRRLAMLRGEVFVLTGPAFTGQERTIGRGVRVPSHVWKIVKDPKRGDVQAFLARNTDDARVEVSSLAAISALTGLRFD